MTVDKLLRLHAERQPGKASVLTAERSITYAELDASVTCLARYFLDRGLRPGDRVAVHWSNSIEIVLLDLRHVLPYIILQIRVPTSSGKF